MEDQLVYKHPETASRILDAARSVFLRKGMDGARMQEIADEAGINKALLHYYFRNKQMLFEAIFRDAFICFFPRIAETLNSEQPIQKKIESFVSSYIDLLIQNPYLPVFILNEIHRNPGKLAKLIRDNGVKPEILIAQIRQDIKRGNISGHVKPVHLIVNILSMCIFPFAGSPMIENLLFNGDREAFQKFLKSRKTEVTRFINDSIAKK